MEARAIAKYVRISPRKLKPITDMVRGMNVDEALAILEYTPRAGAPVLSKVIKSAKANAENNHEMDADKLYIAEIYANQGPTMKRWRAASMGRGVKILKRTSHVGVVLKER
ncbi:50S ribosomal protein L22 [Crassaminicella thermophila]|uniref:Large ribosomal subunit protein uL22 n=1 Tax=Crassaminicella thermophila TaxID=2599308 RepID=A0A5C0SB74_CRATE|nr:50S ribosomal protein L22 [Crassaminicella thermophila]QEK11172.1 50S ribosomal protein L22 [Crassaminicella thermophila]